MNGGKRILAIAAESPETGSSEFLLTDVDEAAPTPHDDWQYAEENEIAPESRLSRYAAPLIAVLLITGWTVAFIWTKIAALSSGISLEQGVGWIADWCLPVALICILWLLNMRTSRREAARFADVSSKLAAETEGLEARLTTINSELSLARDFIAAQARDLESLGRVAAERLGQSAEQLRALIHTNSAQIESIGSVSEAALNNMEKLRGQLPVIANSARDVTNNMGNAGRTAHAQLQEMINGFKRLNEFGQASERQVETLRDVVSSVIEELTADTAMMEQIATRRFSAISEQGAAFRAELESHEQQAIAALQSRVSTLASEIEDQREAFDTGATQSLDALQNRISALRDESSAVSEALATSETAAVASFTERLEKIDTEIIARQQRHQDHIEAIAAHSAAITTHMATMDQRVSELVSHAKDADVDLTTGVQGLTERLEAGRAVLVDANSQIFTLTDASVRLLELIEAGSQHSREKIPAALAEAESKLASVEARITAMQTAVADIADQGGNFNDHLQKSSQDIAAASSQISALHDRIGEQAGAHGETLADLRTSLEQIEVQSSSLAARTQSELASAIEQLTQTANNAVAGISGRLEAEAGSTLDKVIEQRTADVAGQLELAVEKAANASRAATIQLRDQLSKVDELAGNLERRVAQVRDRAEEQIDNDFSRRVALITEALNSNAIDIARTLDSDVSDVAWNSYLKGDRGIFTRRAVKMIEVSEAKAIIQFYENDSDFRSHTNRFIHDFEAMLRQILSTRDGNALGVTLLSSDMGKLYVALAQAIERLRK